MSIRNRTLVADYLEVGEEFVFMGTGFTDLNESPNAKVNKKQYINDKSPTSSIVSYESEFDFETDQVREEKAIEYICDIGETHKTGSDAETYYIKVDLDKPGTTDNTYRARKFKVAIQVDDLGSKDGEMGTKGKLLTQGDLEVGTFNTQTRTFTKGFEPKTH
ncbi:hypothetical protein G6Z16_14990 [Clostridium perfringens]|uniref:hypothetical protein n=1 Tax=Clostridium perfringens TaxID=1502 RepID=UPI0013E29330|nr:hypothetical protein [Clostridium perfringens]NGT68167.1 hypothetical protein [Clostridium perfringens]